MRSQKGYHLFYDNFRQGEYSIEDVFELYLPQVNCLVCGQSDDSIQHAWHPSLHPQIAEIRKLVSEVAKNEGGVSNECFTEIRSGIRKLTGRDLWLPGGSHLGKPSITIKSFRRPKNFEKKFKNLPDVFECAFNVLFSTRAVEALKATGFEILYGPAALVWNGLPRDDYLAVELEPANVFAPTTEEHWNCWICDFCGGGVLKKPAPLPHGANPQWEYYHASKFPERVGISRVRESGSIIASQDFKDAVEDLRLTGFTHG